MAFTRSAVKSKNWRTWRTDGSERGFGLLEALVALVLLSSIGFTLLAWVQQNLDTLQRMRGFYAEQEARKLVAEWLHSLNPMERPNGETSIGETIRLEWKAAPQGDAIRQMGYPRGVGIYDVRLYDIVVSVYRREETQPWFVETVTGIGYRKERTMDMPF